MDLKQLIFLLGAWLTCGALKGLEVESLRADMEGETVLLTWQLPAGSSATCIVLHTKDGLSWDTLGAADPERADHVLRQFSFRHAAVDHGDHYYRILCLLGGGHTGHSAVVYLHVEWPASVLLWPNPCQGRTHLRTPQNGEGNLSVYTLEGNCLLSIPGRDLTNGTLNLEALLPGIYIIKAGAESERLVIER